MTATEKTLDDLGFHDHMKDITCHTSPPVRGNITCGARFDWRCKVGCDDDDNETPSVYRHARVTVVMLNKSQMQEYEENGWYTIPGFRKVHDCGDGEHCAVSYLTFDGQSEDYEENEPDPKQRALVKTWRGRFLDWLESQPEISTIEVTTCASGVSYVRCYLGKPGEEEEMIRFNIEREML